MRASSHNSAGANNRVSMRRRCQTRAEVASPMWTPVAGEADGSLRVETEIHLLAHPQVREAAGLRQCYPEFEARQIFPQQRGGVGAIEQKALYGSDIVSLAVGQFRGLSLQRGSFRPHERFDMCADGNRATT